jgi:Skp family chaperone for outer membrane proteins
MIVTGLATFACIGVFGALLWAQPPQASGQTPPQGEPATLKVGVVNMVKVLKQFDKANYLGETLIKEATTEEQNLKKEQEALAAEKARIAQIQDKAQREAAERGFQDKEFKFSQVMMDYRKKYQEKQGQMAVEVWDNIGRVIDVIAKTKRLELVLTYPDAVTDKDRNTPAAAFQKLAPQAANVAWAHPGLDITDHVIATLNHNFKPPAGVTPASGKVPAPGSNGTP